MVRWGLRRDEIANFVLLLNMKKLLIGFLTYALAGWSAVSPLQADPLNFEVSGMAPLANGGGFITVLDTKTGPEPPWSTRVGVLKVSESGNLTYQPFAISDWGHEEELPNDLEACCPIPGRPDEFLIAESGYYKGRFGRIFHIKVTLVPGSDYYTGEVLSFFRPDLKPAPDYTTPGPLQIEGLGCLKTQGGWAVVLGRRGGKGEPGSLSWGSLTLPDLEYKPVDEVIIDFRPGEKGMRSCADLLLVEREGRQIVLRVAAADPADFGPFSSFVCEAGEFVLDKGKLRYKPFKEQPVWWELDGLKVEALAPCRLGISEYCIGTDDEIYGGVWRPLPKPRKNDNARPKT